jgi:CHAD domain-containing protein
VRYGTEIRRIRRVLRHDGAQVEVALDLGDIIAGGPGAEVRSSLCEVEFELVAGPVQGLLDLAAGWARRFGLLVDPATKSERAQWLAKALAQRPVTRAEPVPLRGEMPLGEARAAMAAAALAHALPNAAAITSGAFGPDHVHQLRVALRRLRTVLRAFGPPDAARDEALSALFAALGGTRDADVMALTLAPAWEAAQVAGLVPPPLARRPAADEPGPAALRQPSTTRLWLALIALSVPGASDDGPAGEPWSRLALKRLQRWHQVAAKEAGQWPTLDDPARHRLRKRLKRLRYLLEFSLPLLPKAAAAREAKALRRLQEALGQWNDQVVARAWLATLDPADPARRFAEGWLAREAAVVEQVCRDTARQWRRLKGEALTLRRRKRR